MSSLVTNPIVPSCDVVLRHVVSSGVSVVSLSVTWCRAAGPRRPSSDRDPFTARRCECRARDVGGGLLAGGASIREIQRLLGHKDLTTTALYTKVDVRALAAMIRRCHPRKRR